MGFLPVHGSQLKLLSEVALAVVWCVGGGLIVLAFNHLPCLGLNKAGGEESCAAMGVGKHRRLVQEQRHDITRNCRAPSPTRHRRRSRAGREPPVQSPSPPTVVAVAPVSCPSCEPRWVCRRGHGRARQAHGSRSQLAGVCAAAGGLLRVRRRASSPPSGFSAGSGGHRVACGTTVLMGPTQQCAGAAGPMWTTCAAAVLLAPFFDTLRHVSSMHSRSGSRPDLEGSPAIAGGLVDHHGAGYFRERQQVSFSCQSALLFICRCGSGKAVTGARVDHQRQLMPILRFGTSCCGSILLSPVKHSSYLRLKTTILDDTGRSDSRGERRLCYRSARTRTLDASIVATSRGSPDPDGPSVPGGSITHVYRGIFAIPFSCLCSVIWEFVLPHRCNLP